jgi:hypothetical protein
MAEGNETGRGTEGKCLIKAALEGVLPLLEEGTTTQLQPRSLELKLSSRQPEETLAPDPRCRKKYECDGELHLWTCNKKKHCPNNTSPKPRTINVNAEVAPNPDLAMPKGKTT